MYPNHVKDAIGVSPASGIGGKPRTSSLDSVQREWAASSMKASGGQMSYVGDHGSANDSVDDLNVIVGGLVQIRKENVHGWRKEKGVDCVGVVKGHVKNWRMLLMYEVMALLAACRMAWIHVLICMSYLIISLF